LIATVGTASITVVNPGGTAGNSVPFHIVATPAIPTLSYAYASYGWYNSGLFDGYFLEADGSGLQLGATIAWNGVTLGVFNGPGGIGVNVPATLMQTPGAVNITASNPGGVPSQPITFTIPPLRTLTSIAPASVLAGASSFTLTVNGTGFASGDQITVWPNSYELSTTFISATQLQATVPASDLASNGTLQVWVNVEPSSTCCFISTNELPLTVGGGGPVLSISKTHGEFRSRPAERGLHDYREQRVGGRSDSRDRWWPGVHCRASRIVERD
jgi:hypothetical protein